MPQSAKSRILRVAKAAGGYVRWQLSAHQVRPSASLVACDEPRSLHKLSCSCIERQNAIAKRLL
jgi:hypothetical protein